MALNRFDNALVSISMWSGTIMDIEVRAGDAVGEEEAVGGSVGVGCVVEVETDSGVTEGEGVTVGVDVGSGV